MKVAYAVAPGKDGFQEGFLVNVEGWMIDDSFVQANSSRSGAERGQALFAPQTPQNEPVPCEALLRAPCVSARDIS